MLVLRMRVIWMSTLLLGAAVAAAGASPPRKVIVGTVVKPFYGAFPGLDNRLAVLSGLIDRLAEQSRNKYGRGLDLAVLPEVVVTGGIYGDLLEHSLPFEGVVQDFFARKAREHNCYIVVPMYLLADKEKRVAYNVGVLVGRRGETVGTYRKLHPAVPAGRDTLEGGITPGKDVPVFQCDFGKLGIQICFDMANDYGWRELKRQGAELVAWPTQSPQTVHPAARAAEGRFYIVSSTWRDNASVFEPTGMITAQASPPDETLVQELDLSYAILSWSAKLQQGAALRKRYGDRVGFRYYNQEDMGIFWSNDPQVPIGSMIQEIGLLDDREELERIRKLYRKAGVPGP
jgi:predicted amidohydrolase